MSCFVMEPSALAAIANAVRMICISGYNGLGFEAPNSLYDELRAYEGIHPLHYRTYTADEIYQRLYEVNVRAYEARYGEVDAPESAVPPTIEVRKYVIHRSVEYQSRGEGNSTTFAVLPWHYQLAKLVDCWLYQTAEGEIAKEPLRLAMKELRNNLYSFIVCHDPAYINAPWGELPLLAGGGNYG